MTIPLSLKETAVVITGAGSGIGRGAALAFAQRGALIGVSDIVAERAEAVAAEIADSGGHAFGMAVDVRNEAELERLRDTCLDRFGRFDVIMNNAGLLAMGPPETLPDEAWERCIDVNLMGLARANRVFLPHLLQQGHGHVVNTASASGLLAYGFDRLPYVSTKHAVVGMSEALAIYLGPKGIGVTCLCPSGVITNIVEQIATYGQSGATPRAPAHAVVTAEHLGDLAADAVEAGEFLVVTAPEMYDELLERGTDYNAYVSARIAEQD